MADATVTSKGKVTIPADVRRASNLQPGDTISSRRCPTDRAAAREDPFARRGGRPTPSAGPKTRPDRAARPRPIGATQAAEPAALMPALDTNVLVRWLVRDDEAQFAAASRVLEAQPGAGGRPGCR